MKAVLNEITCIGDLLYYYYGMTLNAQCTIFSNEKVAVSLQTATLFEYNFLIKNIKIYA